MTIITIRIEESYYNEILKLVKSGEFKSISEVVRQAIIEFLKRRRYPWRDRRELREYLKTKKKKFKPSGEIIEEIRGEESI